MYSLTWSTLVKAGHIGIEASHAGTHVVRVGDPLWEEELQVHVARRITLERGYFGNTIQPLYFGSHYHGNKLILLRHMEDLGAHYLLNKDEYNMLDCFFTHTYYCMLLGSNLPLCTWSR